MTGVHTVKWTRFSSQEVHFTKAPNVTSILRSPHDMSHADLMFDIFSCTKQHKARELGWQQIPSPICYRVEISATQAIVPQSFPEFPVCAKIRAWLLGAQSVLRFLPLSNSSPESDIRWGHSRGRKQEILRWRDAQWFSTVLILPSLLS